MLRTLVVLLAVPALAAPVPKAVAKRPKLDGRWEAVEFLLGKNDSLAGNSWVWVISGEELDALERLGKELRPANAGATCTLSVPDAGRPAEVEYRVKSAKYDYRYPGLMVVGEDEFTICIPNMQGGQRPTEVKPADGCCYVRFKRVKDK